MTNRRYRKPHQYKKRKPFFRKKWIVSIFLVLIAAGAIFYGLFFWKIFWVEKIIVTGEQKLAKEEIESLVSERINNTILFFKTKSLLAVDVERIKKDILDAFPLISEVKISKSFFNTINVQITERTAVALWCANSDCFLIDDQGVIFEKAPPDSKLIIIETAQFPHKFVFSTVVMPAAKIAQIMTIQDRMAETSKIAIKKAVLLSDERLDVETTEGWMIRFNLKGDLDWQATELKLALEKQISPEKRKNLEYIDLRFSRVYYK